MTSLRLLFSPHQAINWVVPIVMLWLVGCQPYDSVPDTSTTQWNSYTGVPSANLTDGCVEDYDPDVDYFPQKITTSYAQHFEVTYHKHYKVVQTTVRYDAVEISADSAAFAQALSDVLVLVQCGAPLPPLEGILEDAHIVHVPVKTAAINYDEDAIRIREIGMLDRLVAIGGGGIYEPTLRQRWEAKDLAGIGYSFHGEPKLEVLSVLRPDITFMTISGLDHAKAMQRVRQLGLPAAPIFSWAEQHYLARAEWTKYNALFFNAEHQASNLFDEIVQNSRTLAEQARVAASKPVALWATFGGKGQWLVHRNDMQALLLHDAGAINVFADTMAAGSWFDDLGLREGTPMSTERVLIEAGDAEYWITWHTSNKNWPEYLSQIKAYRANQIFHPHKRTNFEHDAFDWYETVPVRPDWLLKDLVALFHPTLLPDHQMLFLEKHEEVSRDL